MAMMAKWIVVFHRLPSRNIPKPDCSFRPVCFTWVKIEKAKTGEKTLMLTVSQLIHMSAQTLNLPLYVREHAVRYCAFMRAFVPG